MKNVTFYEEFETKQNKRKNISAGNVIAVYRDEIQSGTRAVYSAIGAVYYEPNSPVCNTGGVSFDYLRKTCKRISEKRAREIHPRLFEVLDRED
jgi:hypothetical protein